MARLETWYKQDLKKPLVVHRHADVFNQDSRGNLIGVEVYSDGEPVTLSGSIDGYCLLSDGTTVSAVGANRTGNKASILIPQTAYNVPGPITITIKNTDGNDITTLCAVVGIVRQSVSGNLVQPGSVVTDWSQSINAQLQAVQDAADNVGAIVAAPFAENTAYVVGNYVTYNGNLYRITADHAAGVTWANTSKTQCTVGTELYDSKSALSSFNVDDIVSSNFLQTIGQGELLSFTHSYNDGHNGFNFTSVTTPYYAAGINSYYAKFDLSIPANSTDVWIGCELPNGFIGINLIGSDKRLRYIQNNSSSTTVLSVNKYVTKITAGQTYNIEVAIVGQEITIFADRNIIQKYVVPDEYNILGVGFLNFKFPTDCITKIYTKTGKNLVLRTTALQGRLADIKDSCVITAQASLFTDTPNGLDGTATIYRYTNGYTLQVYYEYGGTKNTVYYRIVNVNSGASYIDWQPFDSSVIRNTFSEVTAEIAQNNGWESFSDFPSNKIYNVNISNGTNLGFPVSSAGTFFSINSRGGQGSSVNNYRIFAYITNQTAELNRFFLAFGHGTTITPWSSINTYSGPGNLNPIAEALFDSNSKIVFVGDSIVAGLGGTGYDVSQSGGGDYIMYRGFDRYENIQGYCWVNEMISHIREVYGKTNCKNRGVGGITTKQILDNFDVIVDNATMIVLSCGTNDYANNSNVYTYLRQIVKLCLQNKIKIMVMTNTPNNTEDAKKYNAVQGQIQRTCSFIGIPCYDMYAEFEQMRKLKGLSLSDVLGSDGIHPNDTGYGIMYDCALKLFGI